LVHWEGCENVFSALDFDIGLWGCWDGFQIRPRRRDCRLRRPGLELVCLPIAQLRFKSVLAFFDGLQSLQKNREIRMLLIGHGLGSLEKDDDELQGLARSKLKVPGHRFETLLYSFAGPEVGNPMRK